MTSETKTTEDARPPAKRTTDSATPRPGHAVATTAVTHVLGARNPGGGGEFTESALGGSGARTPDQLSKDKSRIADVTDHANKVGNDLDTAVFMYNGPIDNHGLGELLRCMRARDAQERRRNSLLILTTYGGSADSAYQIARALQRSSENFYLCVPFLCKSAGTLVALGANKILMNDDAELGPLDVQLPYPNEIGQSRSGMVVRSALEGLASETNRVWEKAMQGIRESTDSSVKFEMASRLSAKIAVGVMSPIYEKIDPDRLGSDLRDLNVATEYGVRLAKVGMNTKEDTVRRLVEDYPDHGFIIDRAEAEEMFREVGDVNANLQNLIYNLFEVYGARIYSPTHRFVERLDQLTKGPPR